MKSWRTVSGVIGEILVTLGVVVLLFAVWQLWWTDIAANRDQADTVVALERTFTAAPAANKSASAPAAGTPYAIVRIPRLGADYAVPVYQGTDHATLQRGIGHYPSTAGPGQVGNFAIAGHRMTYGGPFRYIEKIQAGDHVIVETAAGWSVYRITTHYITDPTHSIALAPVPEKPGEKPTVAAITLTACHPKYASTYRWVDHGVLEKSFTRAQGLPASYLRAN